MEGDWEHARAALLPGRDARLIAAIRCDVCAIVAEGVVETGHSVGTGLFAHLPMISMTWQVP